MKFVIRDDDLNYFTTPADIERWYASIFAEGIPIGFATIPFVTEDSDVYTGVFPPNTGYAVHQNSALCSYLARQPLVEIMQHGTTHECREGAYEFAQADINYDEKVMAGKQELERACHKPVRVFVAPHDKLSRSGIDAVARAGLHIIRGLEIDTRRVAPRLIDVQGYISVEWYRLTHYRDKARPAYPYPVRFGDHLEACSYRIEHPDLERQLAYVAQKDGVFVVGMHIHDMDDQKLERLQALIQQARAAAADFVLPHQLFE